MKRTVKTVGYQTYIIEEFNSFGELLNTSDSRKQNFGNSGGARTRGDNDFFGASYNEAVKMLRYGWCDKEKLTKITDKIASLEKQQEVQKISFKNDIVGYAPIVPLALKGVPQNMINTTRKPKKAKVITIIVDIGIIGDVTVNEKIEWGAKLTSKIMSLEKQGIRVNLNLIKTFAEDDWHCKVSVCKIPIKSENQPFDIKRMMFPIVHPAMSRRIMWDWYERLPEAQYFSGYGKPIYRHSTRHAEAVKKAITDTDNSYYIAYEDDINEVLKGVA